MTDADHACVHPFPRAEMERRWWLIRAEMAATDVEALITQAANNLTGIAGRYLGHRSAPKTGRT